MSEPERSRLTIAGLRELAEGGQAEQAIAECRERLSTDDQSIELWSLLAELETRAEHKAAAVAAHRKEAELMLHIGDQHQALAVYKTILQLAPQDPDALLAQAQIYRTLGQFNRAALAFELAGQALAARGKTVESLAAIQQLVDMSQENVGRRVRLAEQYAKAGCMDESIREFRIAATALRSANRIEEYGQVVERLCALESHRIESAESSGRTDHDDNSDEEKALQPTKESQRTPTQNSRPELDSHPQDDAAIKIAEAESFLHLGLVDKAISHLEEALTQNPYLKHLRKALVRLYVGQRNYGAAVTQLWELRKQSANGQEEIGYLRFIVRLDPDEAAAREQLANLSALSQAETPNTPEDQISVASMEAELRTELFEHRPATDLVVTSVTRIPVVPLRPIQIPEVGVQKNLRSTLEISPDDIEQEISLQPREVEAARPSAQRPLPPRIPTAAALPVYQEGLTLYSQGRFAEAVDTLRKVPPDPVLGARAALLLGRALFENGSAKEAIETLFQGVSLPNVSEEDLSELMYVLAEFHAKMGDFREAILCYELSMGPRGQFRDAATKVSSLRSRLP